MAFQGDAGVIRWRLHLKASPARVYEMLATEEGRATFWAEAAIARDGAIDFVFPNGLTWHGNVLQADRPRRYAVEYFGGSVSTFVLEEDGAGGTDLTLTDAGVPAPDRVEVIAGWVSVLLALKAAVDFGVDLRNHDSTRTWDQGFVEN